MAELIFEGEELTLRLSAVEKIEAVHADLRVPRDSIRSVEVVDDAHSLVDRGFKQGERVPGRSEVAIVRVQGEKLFAVVHHDTPRGVRINFDGAGYDAWVVGSRDPEALKARLEEG